MCLMLEAQMSSDGGMVPLTLRVLRQAGWRATRLQAGTARGGRTHLADAGWPDIIALSPQGEAWLVECKSGTGRVQREQLEMMNWCFVNDHHYKVVRSTADVEALVAQG